MPAAFLPLGLAYLMFVVGLRLKFADFGTVFARPKALLTGLFVQMCMLPVVAIILVRAFNLSVPMATGLVILAISPGGITSNYIAMLARSDVALSAAMTLITSLAAALTVPTVLAIAGSWVELASANRSGLGSIAAAMAAVSVMPLLAGIGVTRLVPGFTFKAGAALDTLSKLVFALIVISTFIENWNVMTLHAAEVGLACLLLNLAALGLAFAVSKMMRLPQDKATAIAIEAGMQNAAISMFIAANLFGDPALSIPALIYALVMNVTALIIVAWRNALSGRSFRNA